MIQAIVAMTLVVALTGCMSPIPCDEAASQFWTADERHRRVLKLADKSNLLDASDSVQSCSSHSQTPSAFIDAETGKFLAVTQSGMYDKKRGVNRIRARECFDDFTWRRSTKVRPSKSCRPGDMLDLKQINGIQGIEVRRIYSEAEASTGEMEFASRWLIRCLPEKPPFVWLTPDGKLIGVYHSGRFDRFQ